MKIIFWLLAVFSLIIGLFSYVVSAAADGLALFSTQFGKIMCLVGQCSLIVCIICVVIGIFQFQAANAAVRNHLRMSFIHQFDRIVHGIFLSGIAPQQYTSTIFVCSTYAKQP